MTDIINRCIESTSFYTTKFPIKPKVLVFVLRERDPLEYHLEYHQYNVINFDEHEGEVRCAWRLDSSRVDMHKKRRQGTKKVRPNVGANENNSEKY